jgi:hypothetical protein
MHIPPSRPNTAPRRSLIFVALVLAAASSPISCTSGTGLSRSHAANTASPESAAESLEYVRAFSREQQDSLRELHESTPNWGAHKEALEYGDFLNEKAPRLLQIVEQNLPAKQRAQFQKSRAAVEAEVDAAEKENEAVAEANEGGTLARLTRHHGRKIAMKIRIASLSPWIPHLPASLQPELQTICEQTKKE